MVKTLGHRIAELRIERGLNKTQLAEMAGLDRTYISKIESGERTNITINVLEALCEALDYPVEDLLADIGVIKEEAVPLEAWQRDLLRVVQSLPPSIRAVETEKLRLLAGSYQQKQASIRGVDKPQEESDQGTETE